MKPALIIALAAVLYGEDGAAIFQKNCAACHRAASDTRAPLPEALAKMPKEAILKALETGSMKEQGSTLSAADRAAVAAFLGKGSVIAPRAGFCADAAAPLTDTPGWNGWGVDVVNSRFQPAAIGGLSAADVSKLKLKWAFGFQGETAFGQPAVAGGRIFVGSGTPRVFSLDPRSGCIYWAAKTSSMVRTAISFDGRAIFFGDVQANVYSLDAATGAERWKVKVEEHPFARITGAPKLYSGRLYVPVSSIEEVASGNPKYVCCTFRGSVVALDAATGKQIWKSYTIPDPPAATRLSSAGVQQKGPSGAAIWNSPAIDARRRLVYVGTGNAYSEPHVQYTDAILAFDMDTGGMRWARQMTPNDGWNFGCIGANRASCPEHEGLDLDFGASPILRSMADRGSEVRRGVRARSGREWSGGMGEARGTRRSAGRNRVGHGGR